jgi:hypothetical protein
MLDGVCDNYPVASFTTTRAVDVPQAQGLGSLLNTSGGSDVALDVTVAEQLAVSPHLKQVDDALSGPFEIPDPILGQMT